MVVTGVSHACLLIELGPICISMAASLWFKSCEDHSLLKSCNGVYGKNTGLGPYESIALSKQHNFLVVYESIKPCSLLTTCAYENHAHGFQHVRIKALHLVNNTC